MTSSKVHRVAVIGAGLSGLATAVHLKLAATVDRPVDVVVLESSSRIGGVITTETVDVPGVGRFVVDHGADMFATNPPAALRLCTRLGVADRLLLPRQRGRGAMIARGNGLLPIPEGFVLMRATRLSSMLTTPLLSWRAKLRLASEILVRRRSSTVLDESVGSFVRRRMGEEVLQRMVAPLVAGIYTADVERLSMAATMKPIWDMEMEHGSLAAATLSRRRAGVDATEKNSSGARYEQFRAFPGGMIELMQTMVNAIGADSIRLNHAVSAIRVDPTGVFIDPEGERFDDVVLSVPGPAAAKLIASAVAGQPPAIQATVDLAIHRLRSIPHASTAIVVLAVRRDRITRMPETFGFVVPPRENRSILAGSFASEKFDGRAPDGYVIVRAFVGGRLNPEILQKEDAQIVDTVRHELGELIGLDTTLPLDELAPVQRVVRWTDAMPQYEVGHAAIASDVDQAMKCLPHLHLSGNSLHGVGIAPVIGAAERLADRLLKE